MSEPVMVHMRHIRGAKLCASGARAWFAKYNISWNEFLTNGKTADELEATGDPLAFKVTAIARQEIEDGR